MFEHRISHFLYGGERLAVNIESGTTTVCLRLSVDEMKDIIASLEDHNCNKPLDRPFTTAWWEYARRVDTDDPVPVTLYRDDYFNVTLPHAVGEELLQVLTYRLREMEPHCPCCNKPTTAPEQSACPECHKKFDVIADANFLEELKKM